MGQLSNYTNTFTAGTRAKASEVNQNFADIKNAHNDTDDKAFYKNGSKALTGNLDTGNNKITNLGNATSGTDAVSKDYVMGTIFDVTPKGNIYVSTSTNTIEAITPNTSSTISKYLKQLNSVTTWADRPSAIQYGTCSTAGATSVKAVTCDGFDFVQGAMIGIVFDNTNIVASPTLNVNGLGAKEVKWNSSTTSSGQLYFPSNYIIKFVYDGSYFILQRELVRRALQLGSGYQYELYSDGYIRQQVIGTPQSVGSGGAGTQVMTFAIAHKNTDYKFWGIGTNANFTFVASSPTTTTLTIIFKNTGGTTNSNTPIIFTEGY